MKTKLIKKFNLKFSNYIFCLRNKKYVRFNSLNKKKISLNSHINWLNKFTKNKKNKIFLVEFNKKNVGYIRLNYIRKNFILSWALEKKFFNKGIMSAALAKVTSSRSCKYKAFIEKKNYISLKVALNAGFLKKRKYKNLFILYKN